MGRQPKPHCAGWTAQCTVRSACKLPERPSQRLTRACSSATRLAATRSSRLKACRPGSLRRGAASAARMTPGAACSTPMLPASWYLRQGEAVNVAVGSVLGAHAV